MGQLRLFAAGVALALILSASGAAFWAFQRVGVLETENDALRATQTALILARDAARAAQQVALARAQAVEARALEYDKLREDILRNGQDANLPDWMRDAIGGLRSGSNGSADQPASPD